MKKLLLAVTLFSLLFVLSGNSIALASEPSEGFITLTATAHDGNLVVPGTAGFNIIKNYVTVESVSFNLIDNSHSYPILYVDDISYAGNPDHWQSYWHRGGSQYLIDTRVMQTGILTTLHDHEY